MPSIDDKSSDDSLELLQNRKMFVSSYNFTLSYNFCFCFLYIQSPFFGSTIQPTCCIFFSFKNIVKLLDFQSRKQKIIFQIRLCAVREWYNKDSSFPQRIWMEQRPISSDLPNLASICEYSLVKTIVHFWTQFQ